MILSLGEFQFTIKNSVDNFNRNIDTGISFQERVSNHAAALVVKKWEETISIDGETIPVINGCRFLEPLADMAKSQKAYELTTINGYLGKYIITNFKEGRKAFLPDGSFFNQSFNIDLRRVEDESAN